ncbi:MAG: hypothetical protein I3I94_09165 [Acidaminococcaceae bacterium]|nr:hypothetical protein [Acidaminococcaceae bacterium]
MTTRAYVPNVDGEGSIGTTDKKWGAMYVASPDSTASDDRVASTAWVQSIVAEALKTAKDEIYKQAKLDAHPVGSYYWSNDKTSPATLFGGTWEALPAGYTLVAQGSGSDSFGSYTYTAGQKYGERKHQLTTDELPKIKGDTQFRLANGSQNIVGDLNDDRTQSGAFSLVQAGGGKWVWTMQIGTESSTRNTDVLHLEFGKNQPHNNLPPSIACYGWRRTA